MSSNEGGGADNSVVVDNSNANDQGNGGGDNNSGAGDQNQGAGFFAALNEDNRKYAEKKGWKEDPNALLKSYRDLEAAHSKGKSSNSQQQQQPPSDSQPKLPASAADYEFKLPGDFPQDGFYDKKFADTFKSWAHKAKLTGEQAQALHDLYVNDMAGLVRQGTEKTAKDFATAVEASFNDLTKAWGGKDTDGFKRSLEMGRRAMANLDPGLKDALKARGIIGTDAKGQEVVVDATIFKALAKAGGHMFAEDAVFGAPAQAENPFDPKKPNLAKQGELIKNDPELAKKLIEAASNTDWNWWLAKHFPQKK